ncbi:DUF6356 family protein [Phenylobacterium sp.]|uniref:DUF6356 family protein n=1 Tax=Phenylobacterium sp. TaxID=1871053 RepID=UPI002F95890C
MLDRFTRHPYAVGETYLQHARTAGRLGLQLVVAGVACLIHAAAPWLFEDFASRRVRSLHEQMSRRRAPWAWNGEVTGGLGV